MLMTDCLPPHKVHYSTNIKINLLSILMLFFTLTANPQTPQWQFMGLAGEEIYDIAIDSSGNVYVGSEGGVFKTTNNGSNWIFQNNGLIIQNVNKFFIDYEENIYLAGTGSSNTGCGLYKSTDGGGHWAKIADTLNNKPVNTFYDITIIPNEPGGIFYVSNYYGIYRSTENGITWQSTNFTDPGARNIGINTNGYMFFGNDFASWFGIYRSTDLGLNWDRHTFLGVHAMVYLKNGSILAGGYDPGLGSCGVYKTTDNGSSWVNTNTFSGLSCPSNFVLDSNDDIYASVGYVFLSTNNGNSWLNYGLVGQGGYSNLTIDKNGYIWAGSHLDGVYKTAGRSIPVELVSFTFEVNNNNVLLSWVTATEINNQGFQIERRKTKNEEWINVGFVIGNGTTTEPKSYSLIDENLQAGKYQYRLKQIDFDGSFEYSKILEIEVKIPFEFFLSQNYPNPFNPETNIDYIIPNETFVNISLYDVTGRKIRELVKEKKQPGYYTIKLKGGDLSSGIYFYRLTTTSDYCAVKKVTIIK